MDLQGLLDWTPPENVSGEVITSLGDVENAVDVPWDTWSSAGIPTGWRELDVFLGEIG